MPGETENERDERAPEPELQTLDTAKLASLMVKSLRGLALELERLQTRDAAIRVEAKKLMAVVAVCQGVMPPELVTMFGKVKGKQRVSEDPVEAAARSARGAWECPRCGEHTRGRGIPAHKFECQKGVG